MSEHLATTFAALGDPTRLRLVTMLSAGGLLSISQLTASTDISRQAVTKHLEVLASAELVRGHKVGRERRWQLEPARLAEAKVALDQIGRQWEEALVRLKVLIERE